MWAFCLLSGCRLGGGGLARELIIFFYDGANKTMQPLCGFFFGITALKEIFAATSNVAGST